MTYPNPPTLTDWHLGVRPDDMTDRVVSPVPDNEIGTVRDGRASDTRAAINAAYATGEKVILGQSSWGQGTLVVNGSIAPAGNSADGSRTRRITVFDNVRIQARGATPDDQFDEVLGLDRTGGTGGYGSLVGRGPGPQASLPVPTEKIRVLFDLGNTRYSTWEGHVHFHGGKKKNLALLATSGKLNMNTWHGGGGSRWGHIVMSASGYGMYITPKFDAAANDFLSDLMVGSTIDILDINASVTMPMMVAGNSGDAMSIRRMILNNGPGSRSYIGNSHFVIHTAFFNSRSPDDYVWDIEDAGLLIHELYWEGADVPDRTPAAKAIVLKRNSAVFQVDSMKVGAGPKSMLARAIVEDVSRNGRTELRLHEQSGASAGWKHAIYLQQNPDAKRLCQVHFPFAESNNRLPYLMSAPGVTGDQLLSYTNTTAIAQWKPHVGSAAPRKTALTVS